MALYATDGSINVTVVTGSTPVGAYAPDGSLNVILSNPSVVTGLYHASGAMYVTVAYEGSSRSPLPAYAPNGSRYVSIAPFVALEGAMRITVVSGTFATIPPSETNPSLYVDFVNGFCYYNGTYSPVENSISFYRASPGYYFDKDGILRQAGNDVPRYTYDPVTKIPRGLLIEQARTNSIRNSTMVGAAVGSPGTLPTNWSTSFNGLTRTIVNKGTLSNGLEYIDIRFSGNNTVAGNTALVTFEANNVIVASNTQTWSFSVLTSLVDGSFNNISDPFFRLRFNDATTPSTQLSSSNISVPNLDSKLTNVTVTGTATNANTGFTNCSFICSFPTAGTPIDFTIRICAVQQELGICPSSFIPTSTVAVLRSADIVRISDAAISYAIDSVNNKGTWLYNGEVFSPLQVNLRHISTCNIAVPTFDESYGTTISSGVISYLRNVASGGYEFLTGAKPASTPPQITKHAFSFAPGNYWHTTNGASPVIQVSGVGPGTAQDRIYLGTTAHSPGGGSTMCAAIRSLTFWNTNLPSTDAVGITT